MAKKSNNTALLALTGLAGAGALAFALWPRDRRNADVRQFQDHSYYCRKYPDDPTCGKSFDYAEYLRELNERLENAGPPSNPNYQPPGGDPYLEVN